MLYINDSQALYLNGFCRVFKDSTHEEKVKISNSNNAVVNVHYGNKNSLLPYIKPT